MYDFCGIGNSCIDIIADVDGEFLQKWNFPKGICSYVNLEQADRLEVELPNPQYIGGGCAANTAAMISALGGTSSIIGRVANDRIGQMFIEDMAKHNIHYHHSIDTIAGRGSTRVFAFITKDAERTFASYDGVRAYLNKDDLNADLIKQAKFMCLEGYTLLSGTAAEMLLQGAQIAKDAGNRTIFSPCDISILQKYPDETAALEKVSDLILLSEHEACFMAGTTSRTDAIRAMQKRFQSGAVTAGVEGVYAFDQNAIHHVPAATPPAPVMDTNGAGDGFAGGFLFGLANNMSLETSARLGNRCAASIITHAGARPTRDYKLFLADL